MHLNISRLTGAVTAAAVAFGLAACGPDRDVALDDSATLGTDTTTAIAGGTLERDMSEAGIMGLLSAANAAEIEAANVALERTRNAQVRQFAQRMRDEHTQMMRQGEQLAQSLNVQPVVPRDDDDLISDHKDHMQELSEQSDDFDSKFMDAMIDDHQNTLEFIDRAMESTQNAQLRQHLQAARPKVDQHLQQARQIKDRLG